MRLKLRLRTTRNRLPVFLGLAGLLAATLLALGPLRHPPPADSPTLTVDRWAGPWRPAPGLPDPWPLTLAASASSRVEGRLRPGSTLSGVLAEAGLFPAVAERIVAAAREAYDLRRLRSGRPYRLYFDAAEEPVLFRYQPDAETALFVVRAEEGWRAALLPLPHRVRPRFVRAAITGSLEGSLARTSLGREGARTLAQKVADLYAWDVDFAADLQPGDRLDLLVEERYLEGEFVGYGEILAAELNNNGRLLQAVRFQAPDKEEPAYFTPDGSSLRRTFLRSPVRYTRISSRFTARRIHPVLKVSRPHYGVDYAAPPGTPVQATADGLVTFAGRGAGAGRYVKIRHGGSYTSWYLHLSRFAQGIRPGVQVTQGQTLGYVGKSGLATSYHLHYQLSRNGQFVDPLKVQFPPAEPIPQEHRAAFAAQSHRWMELLRRGQNAAAPLQMAGGGA